MLKTCLLVGPNAIQHLNLEVARCAARGSSQPQGFLDHLRIVRADHRVPLSLHQHPQGLEIGTSDLRVSPVGNGRGLVVRALDQTYSRSGTHELGQVLRRPIKHRLNGDPDVWVVLPECEEHIQVSAGKMATVTLTKVEREKAADLIKRVIDLVDDGDLAVDGPAAVTLVRRLEGAVIALRIMDAHVIPVESEANGRRAEKFRES
jgi:hypothetical protein